jgi:glycosyltransferase involved in cell wall biosynthesis
LSKKIKILLSAYACEPHKGSEPHAGWCWAEYLSKDCDVTVLTRSNNRDPIEQALAEREGPAPRFLYYDLPGWLVRLKKRGLPVSLYYFLWQIGARLRISRHLCEYDLVHHVTFNSFLVPGFWWGRRTIVVLGPLGGGMTTPVRLLPLFGRQRWRERLRTCIVRVGSFSPNIALSMKSASAVIAANSDTTRRLAGFRTSDIGSMIDVGIRAARAEDPPSPKISDSLRVIWVGSLEPRKAPLLALEALFHVGDRLKSLELEFVGDGPQKDELRRLAATLNLSHRVHFRGRLPHAEAVAGFRRADIFLFTSIRDTSGNVLLEAMAAGLPSVVLSHQGAAEMTTPETAIRVAPSDPETVARRFADGILTLARDPDLRVRMGEAARQRVLEHFTWEEKSKAMLAIYERALAQRAA